MIHFTRIEIGQEVNLYIKSTTNFSSRLNIFFVKNGDHLLKKTTLKNKSIIFSHHHQTVRWGHTLQNESSKKPSENFSEGDPIAFKDDRENVSRRLTSHSIL